MNNRYRSINKKLSLLSGSIGHAMQSSSKSQKNKLLNANTTNIVPQVLLIKLYMYINKTWVFKGYACRYCSAVFNDDIVLENHRYICKELN